ncbi:MAG: insulinase family protein, partial [Gemmatimonadota bacterium]|nr:insulinase family protein [Gemmatimonadota bacterium]
ALMRYGGTATRTPAEVDEAIAFYALQVSFGTGGGSITTSINTLTEHVDMAIALWSELLVAPSFDAAEIDAWRARQLEGVRRRADDPGRLAVVEINRLLFGDHPVGWEMAPEDLAPELLTPERLHELRGRIVCRENLVLGFTGDISWPEAQPLAERLLARLPACPEPLPTEPAPQIRRAPGVFLLAKDVEQAVVVMAHPTAVRLADDDDYYSALIGNSILGAGGFSSRLMHRLRTEEGFAYSATSLWTTPRTHEGVVGAMTRTRPENVAPAIDVVLETMATLRDAPPSREEVATTVDQIVNGFVFNFDSPDQIVSRTMYYRALDLPDDWLQRYWNGVQRVDPESVHGVFQRHLKPDEMTILVVGDPVRIGVESLRRFGPVVALDVETGSTTPIPSGSPRFRPIPGSTPRR